MIFSGARSADTAGAVASEAHLWFCDISRLPADRARAVSVLDDDERERMERFVFERDRDRFLASHVFLRTVLARYVRATPLQLRFVKAQHGKPSLLTHGADAAPAFNLSHSGDRALLAVVPGASEVGVDIEHHRPGRRLEALARKNFAQPEIERLLTAPAVTRDALFYRVWTLKEAYVKARATGLSLRLDGFWFGFGDDGSLTIDARPDIDALPRRWHCVSWNPEGGYSAALVHDAESALKLRWFEFAPPGHVDEVEVAVGFRTRG